MGLRRMCACVHVRVFAVRVADPATRAPGTAYTATVDTLAPTTTGAVTAITDNVGIVTGTVTSGSTTDDTSLALSGTLSAALVAGETVRVCAVRRVMHTQTQGFRKMGTD